MDLLPLLRDLSLASTTAPSSISISKESRHLGSHHYHFRATQRLRSYSHGGTHALSEALLPSSTSPAHAHATPNLSVSVCDSDAPPTSACMNILPSRPSRSRKSSSGDGNTSPPPAISKNVKPPSRSFPLGRRSRVMGMGNSERPTFHSRARVRVRTQGLVIEALQGKRKQSRLYPENADNQSRPSCRVPLTDIPDSTGNAYGNSSIRPHLRPGAASNSTTLSMSSLPKRSCRIFEPTLDVVDIINYLELEETLFPSDMHLEVDQALNALHLDLEKPPSPLFPSCTDMSGLPQDMLDMCAQLDILAAQVQRMDVPCFDTVAVKFPRHYDSGIDVTLPCSYFENRHFPSVEPENDNDNEDATRVLLGREWPTKFAGLGGDRLEPDQGIMESDSLDKGSRALRSRLPVTGNVFCKNLQTSEWDPNKPLASSSRSAEPNFDLAI